MDRTRDFERDGDIQQEGGRVFFCDGYDRGVTGISDPQRTFAYCHSVSLQVFTGAVPFSNSLPTATMLAIMDGRRPPRPDHPQLTDHLWVLMQRCWDQNPLSRPEISEVFKSFRGRWVSWFLVIKQPLTFLFSHV